MHKFVRSPDFYENQILSRY